MSHYQITYVLEAEGFTAYFGADTLLIPELGEIAKRFFIDRTVLER